MTERRRPPRVWIDVEHGACFGRPAASVRVFTELRSCFGSFTQAWLFHSGGAPLIRCFYYPAVSHQRFGIPRGLGPRMVLIDEFDDQLWLNAAACGSGENATCAMTILKALDFAVPVVAGAGAALPLAGYDEMHFVDKELASTRSVNHRRPAHPPGRTFVRNGRLVCRMQFDKGGASAPDLLQLWAMSTERYGWLGRVTALTRYDGKRRSEEFGHEGCQLIAAGESGRELWLQLPEPDGYDRLSGRRRDLYEGAFTEYQAAEQTIFRSVGADLEPADDRPWRQRILGRHRTTPDVIRWPGD